MITRRTAAVLLGSASLALAVAATGPAAAHSGHGQAAHAGKKASAAGKARAHRHHVRAYRRALRHCSLSTDELLTAGNNEHLKLVTDRLAQLVAEGKITQERADRWFARAQKRTTIRVTFRTASQAPVLALFGVTTADDFRAAIKSAGGLRALIEKTEGVTRADFRAALRAGAKAGRKAVIAICAADTAKKAAPAA